MKLINENKLTQEEAENILLDLEDMEDDEEGNLVFDLEIYEIVFIAFFAIAFVFGFFAQQKQFCFSGSLKDYIQIKSTKRAASVVMAMIVAIISTQIFASIFDIDLSSSSYFKSNINYFAITIGGALFGAGMMIADGCSSRSIVKFSQGDANALVTLLFLLQFLHLLVQKGFYLEL